MSTVARQGEELLDRIELRSRILRLRRAGLSYQRIADALAAPEDPRDEPVKISHQAVAQYVKRYLAQTAREDAETVEELRQLENERLDDMLAAWLTKAKGGDEKAAHIVIRVMERRARMNGLDAAQKHEHNVNGSILHELGVDPDELRRSAEAFRTAYPGEVQGVAFDLEPERLLDAPVDR